MHSPGVCGVILALGPAGPGAAQEVDARIDALNAASDLVLVAAPAPVAQALSPAVWSRAAYVVELAEGAAEAEVMRAALGEVMSRGRDAALLTWLGGARLTAEAAAKLVEFYAAAGDETWAVVESSEALSQGQAVLVGRDMIERLLRTAGWTSAEEIFTANRAHVGTLRKQDAALGAQ